MTPVERNANANAALQAALEELQQYKTLNQVKAELVGEQRAEIVKLSKELYAALEEVARVTQERNEFALALQYRCPVCNGDGAVETCGPDDEPVLEECAQCAPARRHLAAHDQQVAARVCEHAADFWRERGREIEMLVMVSMAHQYRSGAREVPK